MGSLLSYSISSAIVLALLYLTYKWVLASENYHRLNRAILWTIYAVALCITPLAGLTDSLIPAAEVTAPVIGIDMPVAIAAVAADPSPGAWLIWLVALYAAGVVTVAAMTLWNLARLVSITGRGRRVDIDGHKVVLTDENGLAPFSFGRTIVIPRRDYAESGTMIFRHERSHVELHHWVDLLMAQAVCILQWFNPAAWLMREEFKTVHEYQADRRVISSGANAKEYQMLLIKKAVGARFPSLANSLNHSKLKKRITMMYNQKHSRRRALRPLALLPALGVAMWVTQLPAVASAVSALGETALTSPGHKVSEIAAPLQADGSVTVTSADAGDLAPATTAGTPAPAADAKTAPVKESKTDVTFGEVEQMPEFPGGMSALLQFLSDNINYPKGAEDVSGRVVVRFVVDKDGSVRDPEILKSVDPLLDAEALRVVGLLPKFTPGRLDNKPVAVHYALPISFKAYDPQTPSTPSARSTPSTRSTPSAQTSATPNTMTVTTVDDKTGHRTSYSTSTSSSISTTNGPDGSTVTTTKTVHDNGTTTTTVIKNSKGGTDGATTATVSVTGHDGKEVRPEIYVDGKLYTGDITAIPSSDITSMNVDKSSDRMRIDITTKH